MKRRSNAGPSGPESSSIVGKCQAPLQLRSQQQLQQSQQSFSQGFSSQHGLFSPFSQNSQEETITNELVHVEFIYNLQTCTRKLLKIRWDLDLKISWDSWRRSNFSSLFLSIKDKSVCVIIPDGYKSEMIHLKKT